MWAVNVQNYTILPGTLNRQKPPVFYSENGRFSCMRSKRKSLLHNAPADFSTASGENSGADGANSRQNQGVSAVPTGAPVSLWRRAHRPMRACHTGSSTWIIQGGKIL